MEGIAFLFAIIAVGLVILWSRRNDKVPVDGLTSGLLAMPARRRTKPKVRYYRTPAQPDAEDKSSH